MTRASGWKPTHIHVKTKRVYMVHDKRVIIEKTKTECVLYEDAKGVHWVRPVDEFFDGRFRSIK